MRVSGSRVYSRPAPVPKMPPGLVELMEGLTRDVLKNNPLDVYEFCAEHMWKLLEIRDGPSNKKEISLEQKILRAQEKVNKRAKQRWRRMELEEKANSEIIDTVNSSSITPAVEENVSETALKPVHHDHDLTNTSEIEISCEPETSVVQETQREDEIESCPENIGQENVMKDEKTNLAEELESEVTTQAHQDTCENVGENESRPKQCDDENISEPTCDDVNCNSDSGCGEIISDNMAKDVPNLITRASHEKAHTISVSEVQSVKIDNQSEDVEATFSTVNVVAVSNPVVENNDSNLQIVNLNNADVADHASEQEIATLENNGSKLEATPSNLKNYNAVESVTELVESSEKVDLDNKDTGANESLKDVRTEKPNEGEITVNTCNNSEEENRNISEIKNFDSINDFNIINETNNEICKEPEQAEISGNVKDDGSINPVNADKVFSDSVKESESDKAIDVAEETASSDSNDKIRNDNAMDLETAAVTIQKVFRTFLFKSRASTFDESTNEENNLSDEEDKKDEMQQFLSSNMNKERRTLGISRMDTVLQTVNEEKSLSLSTDDSSLSSAATIIQAHVRGFLVRNKLCSGKTASSNSLAISKEPSSTSIDGDADQNKNKTVLNIHIVPEGGNYLSRDESMITSMDLSLDGSPPSSVNLHPLVYNTSERRKLLKREDAVQSVSPPSNNSGKLSEDVDSVKELTINENEPNANQDEKATMAALLKDDSRQEIEVEGSIETTPTNSLTIETVVEDVKTSNTDILSSPDLVTDSPEKNKKSLTKQSSDEMDVVTPFKENDSPIDDTHKLLHSGEFHDAALPTKVSRSDTPVVSEFKNVLVYFLLWNNS